MASKITRMEAPSAEILIGIVPEPNTFRPSPKNVTETVRQFTPANFRILISSFLQRKERYLQISSRAMHGVLGVFVARDNVF